MGAMPVRDAGARIVGIFSERDIVRAFSKGVELCSESGALDPYLFDFRHCADLRILSGVYQALCYDPHPNR